MPNIRFTRVVVAVFTVCGLASPSLLGQLQVDRPVNTPRIQTPGHLAVEQPARDAAQPVEIKRNPGANGDGVKMQVPDGWKLDAPANWIEALGADTEVKAAYKTLLLAQWSRDTEIMNERKAAFTWQHMTSKIMFWVVHLFLGVAVIVAVFEFIAANRKRKEAPSTQDILTLQQDRLKTLASMPGSADPAKDLAAAKAAASTEESPTELKMGMEGIALKTALHGVIILALAMGFYFMYLKFVYPISNVSGN